MALVIAGEHAVGWWARRLSRSPVGISVPVASEVQSFKGQAELCDPMFISTSQAICLSEFRPVLTSEVYTSRNVMLVMPRSRPALVEGVMGGCLLGQLVRMTGQYSSIMARLLDLPVLLADRCGRLSPVCGGDRPWLFLVRLFC